MNKNQLIDKLQDLSTRAFITSSDKPQEVMKLALEELKQQEAGGWQDASVPPKGKKPVLVWLGGNKFAVQEYRVSTWEDVLLWMEIPAVPK